MFLATGFYTGYAPFAPGTFGTIPGILICYIISGYDITIAILYTLLVIIISIPVAHEAGKITGKNDPGCIVVDEITGILVTLLGIPFNITTVISGFIIFRFLDISKPFPIRYLEYLRLSFSYLLIFSPSPFLSFRFPASWLPSFPAYVSLTFRPSQHLTFFLFSFQASVLPSLPACQLFLFVFPAPALAEPACKHKRKSRISRV